MELWIRSQDKKTLVKVDKISIYPCDDGWLIGKDIYNSYGIYKTEERALEVLDEIQGKLQNKFLCKPTCIMSRKDINKEEEILNWKYDENFIFQPHTIDIEPINCDVVVYEMPKE